MNIRTASPVGLPLRAARKRQASNDASARTPTGCTNLKLRQLTRRVSRLYDAQLAHCGLKTTQYSLLACVDSLGPLQPGEIARHLSLDPSTLTRNLQPLEDAGWVRVDAGPDARSRLVVITASGREKRSQARGHWKRAQLSLNRMLGEDRVAMLHELLDQLQTTLDATENTVSHTAS
jgi:DNA-binding MarR family transcriptional regulator